MGSFLDTEISGVLINSVSSEEVLKEIQDAGLLEPNKIYLTPDEDSRNFQIKQIWENKNPSVSFAGQTINLDLTNYHLILIVFRMETSDATSISNIFAKGYGGYIGVPYTLANRYQRSIGNISNTGISISDGVKGSGYDNSVCIPIFIYGISNTY